LRHLRLLRQGTIAVFFAGLFVGTLFLSRIADRFGRRTIFNFSLLWYSFCTVAMAFQTNAPAILFFRFVAGIGIGMELVVIDMYLSELVPKASRGKEFAFNQILSFLAIPVVALASFFLVPQRFGGLDGWRWVTLIGSTGALLVFVMRRNLTESPRWLDESGRHQEADRIVRQIEEQVQRAIGGKLTEPEMAEDADTPAFHHSARRIRGQPVRRSPSSVLSTAQVGLASEARSTTRTWAKSLEYSFIIAFANPIAPLIGQLFAERIERKWQIV
jgi:putative MFS transporter